jgi:hypothetical protein
MMKRVEATMVTLESKFSGVGWLVSGDCESTAASAGPGTPALDLEHSQIRVRARGHQGILAGGGDIVRNGRPNHR